MSLSHLNLFLFYLFIFVSIFYHEHVILGEILANSNSKSHWTVVAPASKYVAGGWGKETVNMQKNCCFWYFEAENLANVILGGGRGEKLVGYDFFLNVPRASCILCTATPFRIHPPGEKNWSHAERPLKNVFPLQIDDPSWEKWIKDHADRQRISFTDFIN